MKRVGGLTFWRIGRFGGSFYVARKPAPVYGRRYAVLLRSAAFAVGVALSLI